MGTKWRDEDAYERLARMEREDDLGPFRGLVFAFGLALLMWAVLFGVAWLLLR